MNDNHVEVDLSWPQADPDITLRVLYGLQRQYQPNMAGGSGRATKLELDDPRAAK